MAEDYRDPLPVDSEFGEDSARSVTLAVVGHVVEANVPGWGILALVGLYKALEALGKAIPDDATGWRAVLRKIATVVTFYIPNKVTA